MISTRPSETYNDPLGDSTLPSVEKSKAESSVMRGR